VDESERTATLEAELRRLEIAVRDRATALVQAREASRQSRLAAEEMGRELERAERERDAALAKVDRVVRNPIVRIGLVALRAVRRARGSATTWRPRVGGASLLAERRLKRRLLAQLPGPPSDHGPRVTIVILNRNGVGHLRKLLPALESVAYRDVEIVLVDNASSDSSVAFTRSHRSRFPIRIIQNDENLSFSDANNLVPRDSDAELVLFLNNDVRPLEPHWLGWMVETVTTTGVVACGARLIQPRRLRFGSNAPGIQSDLELQHAGIRFDWMDGMPRPWNIGGRDPVADGLATVRERPAATAACLLVRRDAFMAVDGFDPAYVYGHEDVDLCLRLRALGGRIVVDGRAALWHDESATRRRNRWETVLRQRANRDTFYARWGRQLFREVLLDRLDGRGFLSEQLPACAIVVAPDSGHDPGERATTISTALSAGGWSTSVVVAGGEAWPTRADFVLVTDSRVDVRELPRSVIRAAWIVGAADPWIATPWIDDFDVVLAETDEAVEAIRAGTSKVARRLPDDAQSTTALADEIRAELRRWVATRRVGILIQADDWERAPTSGDYHFARALQRQFERRGLPTTVYLRPDWKAPVSTRDDLLIHLWGRYPIERRPGQTTLLWILYHPELVTDELLDSYDLVLVASDRFAELVARRTKTPVVALHQATDPERFRPGMAGPGHELLFVGNSRGVRRPVLDDITPTRHDLAVYGGGWPPDLLDPVHLRGSSVPNEELPGYYGSAAIVLNDHWQEAGEAGFLNNRLYDVLASGGFVISDAIEGLREEFDDGVVAYRDAADLVRLVERYLDDPAARADRVERGRRAVLDRHTFSHRVDEILRLVERLEPPQPEVLTARDPQPATNAAGGHGRV
jgi:GT2 family glycosyltransferase